MQYEQNYIMQQQPLQTNSNITNQVNGPVGSSSKNASVPLQLKAGGNHSSHHSSSRAKENNSTSIGSHGHVALRQRNTVYVPSHSNNGFHKSHASISNVHRGSSANGKYGGYHHGAVGYQTTSN